MIDVVRRNVKCALIEAWRVLASALSNAVRVCCPTGSAAEVGAAIPLIEGGNESARDAEMEVGEMLLLGLSESPVTVSFYQEISMKFESKLR